MTIEANGCLINWNEEGTGIPVFTLHGFGIDHRMMRGALEPVFGSPSLSKEGTGYRRIYFDLPGMGKTEKCAHITSSDMMLETILKVKEKLVGASGRYIVAGESYGGFLARALMKHDRERILGLMLICPLVIPEADKRTLEKLVVFQRDETFLKSLAPGEREEYESFCVVQTADNYKRTAPEILSGVSAANAEQLGTIRMNYAFSDNPDDTSPYEQPALFFGGRQDNSVGFYDMIPLLSLYPRATFAVLDRAGHNLQIEQASLFNALVGEWLNRVSEYAARRRP